MFTAQLKVAPLARWLVFVLVLAWLNSSSHAQGQADDHGDTSRAEVTADAGQDEGDSHGVEGHSSSNGDAHKPDGSEGHGDADHSDGDHDGHGESHGGGHGESHGGGHHDPFDLTAANATDSLEAVEEVRADLAIWTVVVFALLLAVLGKFAWGPICKALDEREQGIASQIDEAHRSNEEARRLLAEHEEKVAKASDEVREMLDKAKADAESQKASILAAAEAAAKSEKDRAVREIHAAKNTALEQLAESSVDQALGLAGSIVGKKLDKKDHASLIQDALKHIPSDN